MAFKRRLRPQGQRLVLLNFFFQRLLEMFQPLAGCLVKQSGKKGRLVGKRAGGQRGGKLLFAFLHLCLLLAFLLAQRLPLAL